MPLSIKRRLLITSSIISLILLSSFTTNADTVNYTYDDLNRLRKVDYGNGYVIEYDYDEVGNRQVGKVMLNPHTLTVQKAGTGANWGTVTASQVGISCGSRCSDLFSEGTVTLTVATRGADVFTGWAGGGCGGTGACVINLTADTNVTANFQCPAQPVRIGSSPYWTIHDAYNAASDGSVIKSTSTTIVDSLNTTLAKSVTLDGGYDACYADKSGSTTLQGSITTNMGTLTVKDFILSQ